MCLCAGECDYINASKICSKDGEVPAWQYIATQGPLPTTVPDFWQMVFEQQSSVVIMLTRLKEGRNRLKQVDKCAAYFPESTTNSAVYGQLSISVRSVKELDADITMRQLELTDHSTSVTRKVCSWGLRVY